MGFNSGLKGLNTERRE